MGYEYKKQVSVDSLLGVHEKHEITCPRINPLQFDAECSSKAYKVELEFDPKHLKLDLKELFTAMNDLDQWSKDILDVLTHPLVEPYANAQGLVRIIKENNYTFITRQKILELHPNQSKFFTLLFEKWENGSVAVLNNISALLIAVKEHFSNDNEEEKIAKAFVYGVFKVINKLGFSRSSRSFGQILVIGQHINQRRFSHI